MKKFLFLLILILTFCLPLLSQAYQPKLLWTKYIGNQPGAAVISNDDKYIYCTEGTKLIKLDIDSGTILKTWDIGGRGAIIRISNDDKTLYIGCYQGLKIFDLIQEKVIKEFEPFQVASLDISTDNTKLIYYSLSNSLNDSARLISLPDYRQIQAFRYSQFNNPDNYLFYGIWHAKFFPDGQRIAWCSTYMDNQTSSGIDIYDISQNKIITTINAHTAKINDIAISSDGLLIASAADYGDRSLKVWDVATKQTIFNQQLLDDHVILKLNFDHLNKLLLAGGDLSAPASIWNYKNNNKILDIEGLNYGTKGIVPTKDDKKLFIFSLNMELYTLEIDTLLSVNDSINTIQDILYPNPINNELNLSIILPTNSNYMINIENLQGILTKQLYNGNLISGLNILNFNVSDISNGTYFLRISTSNFEKVFKLIKEN